MVELPPLLPNEILAIEEKIQQYMDESDKGNEFYDEIKLAVAKKECL
jgi:hypothetical protein